MAATTAFETALLKHYFQNLDHANVGSAAGLQNSSGAGVFYISLHTSDPGATGTQATNETVYSNYARVPVARSVAGWTVADGAVVNAAAILFPECGAVEETVTYFGIGSAATGAGNLFFRGYLDEVLEVEEGATPTFALGQLSVPAA